QLYLRTLPSNSDWLFPSRQDPRKPITPRTVQRILAPYGLHPHALRHTFLRSLLRSGTDISSVAALAGHQNLTTTLRYTLPHMEELEQAIDRAFRA
ncbi:MAG: tyrosine-type recombinase/integrase, partial [Clostridiales bacterium]|nr:tyrosine-type recombinase/integrase [Clostridiales bacterium]